MNIRNSINILSRVKFLTMVNIDREFRQVRLAEDHKKTSFVIDGSFRIQRNAILKYECLSNTNEYL
jgi:hypothetical protein